MRTTRAVLLGPWPPPATAFTSGRLLPTAGLAPDHGVHLHPLSGGYGVRGLRELSRELGQLTGPKRILVQYVPHAFGMRAMNVPFCAWLAALQDGEVWIMFHEVALPWDRIPRWKANVGAAVTRVMANLLVARADRVFISVPWWDPYLRGMAPYWRGDATWLPIPSERAGVGLRARHRAGPVPAATFATGQRRRLDISATVAR